MFRIPCTTTLASICLLAAAHAAAAPIPAMARDDVADRGAAPAATQVVLSFVLAYRDQAGLEALIRAQATPGDAQFHRYLTPAAFAARFAPTEAQVASLAATLARAGFTVTGVSSNRTLLHAAAPAAAVQAYFATALHLVTQAGQPGLRIANVTPATLPAELTGSVRSVLGLDTLIKIHSNRRKAAAHDGAQPAGLSAAGQPVTSPYGGIFPAGFAAAYHYPAATGAGHAIGIVIDSDIADSDLVKYWRAAKVTRTGAINRVLVENANPGVTGDVGETAIDVESTSSLAPGADIDIYLMQSLADMDITDTYNRAVSDNAVDVVSSSFGGCEFGETQLATAANAIAQQGAALGITFTASTGDQGGYCTTSNNAGHVAYHKDIINAPASIPYFVAVGGTTLTITTTGARSTETAWSPGGSAGGGTGGVSGQFAIPAYQQGVVGIAVVPTVVSNNPVNRTNGGFAGRNVPDISLDASSDYSSCMAVYDTSDYGWTCYGGTSVANPVFAALVALDNQVAGSKAGFLNPTLYADYTAGGTAPAGVYGTKFYDVLKGSIGGGWAAKNGYDQATGIGAINGGSY